MTLLAGAVPEPFDVDHWRSLSLCITRLVREMGRHLFCEAAHHVECHCLLLSEIRGGEDLVNAELRIDRKPIDHLVAPAKQDVGGEIVSCLIPGKGAYHTFVHDPGSAEYVVEALVVSVSVLRNVLPLFS